MIINEGICSPVTINVDMANFVPISVRQFMTAPINTKNWKGSAEEQGISAHIYMYRVQDMHNEEPNQ